MTTDNNEMAYERLLSIDPRYLACLTDPTSSEEAGPAYQPQVDYAALERAEPWFWFKKYFRYHRSPAHLVKDMCTPVPMPGQAREGDAGEAPAGQGLYFFFEPDSPGSWGVSLQAVTLDVEPADLQHPFRPECLHVAATCSPAWEFTVSAARRPAGSGKRSMAEIVTDPHIPPHTAVNTLLVKTGPSLPWVNLPYPQNVGPRAGAACFDPDLFDIDPEVWTLSHQRLATWLALVRALVENLPGKLTAVDLLLVRPLPEAQGLSDRLFMRCRSGDADCPWLTSLDMSSKQ